MILNLTMLSLVIIGGMHCAAWLGRQQDMLDCIQELELELEDEMGVQRDISEAILVLEAHSLEIPTSYFRRAFRSDVRIYQLESTLRGIKKWRT